MDLINNPQPTSMFPNKKEVIFVDYLEFTTAVQTAYRLGKFEFIDAPSGIFRYKVPPAEQIKDYFNKYDLEALKEIFQTGICDYLDAGLIFALMAGDGLIEAGAIYLLDLTC